ERLGAELEKVRRQGWALGDQELEEGPRPVAVPIPDRNGRGGAAVNVGAPATARSVEAIRASALPPLLRTAAASARELAADAGTPLRPPPPTPSPEERPAERGGDFVQSLERGLAVIRTFDGTSSQTLSEVAVASGLTRAAARRFLLTLAELGYVE